MSSKDEKKMPHVLLMKMKRGFKKMIHKELTTRFGVDFEKSATKARQHWNVLKVVMAMNVTLEVLS